MLENISIPLYDFLISSIKLLIRTAQKSLQWLFGETWHSLFLHSNRWHVTFLLLKYLILKQAGLCKGNFLPTKQCTLQVYIRKRCKFFLAIPPSATLRQILLMLSFQHKFLNACMYWMQRNLYFVWFLDILSHKAFPCSGISPEPEFHSCFPCPAVFWSFLVFYSYSIGCYSDPPGSN